MAGAGNAMEASDGTAQAPEVSQVPVARRRMAVDEGGSREGPLIDPIAAPAADTKADAPAPSNSGSRHVDQPSPRSGPVVTETGDPKPRCGSWHRADEPALPPCPTPAATTDSQKPPQSH